GAATPDRLRDLSVAGAGGRVALARDAWRPQGDTTWLTLTTGSSGTYVVGASLLPREIALAAKDFNAYLEEDGIPDVLAARTRDGELTRTRASDIRSTSRQFSRSAICGRERSKPSWDIRRRCCRSPITT